MLNIINYEIKRAFRSKSTYIILGVLLLLLTLPIYLEYYLIKDASSLDEVNMLGANNQSEVKVEITDEKAKDISDEKKINPDKKLDEKELKIQQEQMIIKNFSLQNIINNISTSGPISIFFILFVAMAASKDYSSGYIKNLMTIKNYRIYQPIAKIIVSVIFSIIIFIVTFIIYFIIAKILSGNVDLDYHKLIKFIATVLVGQLAMTSLVILIANYTSSQTTTIVLSLLLIVGMINPILLLIDGLNFLPIKLLDYSLFNNFGGFFTGLSNPDFIDKMKDIFKISIPMIVVYLGLNFLVLKNKDINLG